MTLPASPLCIDIPARTLPMPAHLSEEARISLAPSPTPLPFPPPEDKAAWRAYADAADEGTATMFREMIGDNAAHVLERHVGGVPFFDITPKTAAENGMIVLDIHGGGLFLGGGEACRWTGIYTALRLRRRVWSVDYRMLPNYPYPAGLDDCFTVYRNLVRERTPSSIAVYGVSAGGNLASALMLRARDEEVSMPMGLVLVSPEVDLTESGDSFQTNRGVDPGIGSVMPVNRLYANGRNLAHPYLSPLFGDLTGFPPTLLVSGTRDLYLSNSVRMHRALRLDGVTADLHIMEAAAHRGFPGAPEGEQIDAEIRAFLTL